LADPSVPRRLEIVGDAAFKRRDEPDLKSRGGMILNIGVDKSITDRVGILGWASKKINRVCKSPTGAETINVSACIDEVDFMYLLAVSFYPNMDSCSIVYTDSFSLTSTQDKYTKEVNPNLAVDVAIIRQRVRNGEVILVHIPGDFMPADGLTKAEKKAQIPLIEFFNSNRIGDRGVPFEVVDEALESEILSDLQAGKIFAHGVSNLTEECFAKFAEKHYSAVLVHWAHQQESAAYSTSFIASQ